MTLGERVDLPLALNHCELKTSLSPFFPAINKVGSTIYLVCKYSLRTCRVLAHYICAADVSVWVQSHDNMQKVCEGSVRGRLDLTARKAWM